MKNILVVFGGDSSESEVSVMSAIEGMEAIPFVDYKVFPAYVKNGKWYTGEELKSVKTYLNFNEKKAQRITLIGKDLYFLKGKRWKYLSTMDCALLFTHGGNGENGVLQGYLEMQGLPYTSSGVYGSALTMDKWATKTLAKECGIDVVKGMLISNNCPENEEILQKSIGYPMFIKPNTQGSSIGVGKAVDKATFEERVKNAFLYDKDVLVEKCIENGVEYNCAVLGVGERIIVSEVEKVISANDFLSFEDKYISNESKTEKECPANISEALRTEIKVKTSEIYQKLHLKGVVRFDFIFKDKLYLNEINNIPGSLANHLFLGCSYGELLSLIIDDAIDRGIESSKEFTSQILTQGKKK